MLTFRRKGLVTILITLLVLAAGYGDFRPSSFDLTVAPYKYSLVQWETSHFLDKWLHKLSDLMPWTAEPSREERLAQISEFFDLGKELRELAVSLKDELRAPLEHLLGLVKLPAKPRVNLELGDGLEAFGDLPLLAALKSHTPCNGVWACWSS